jgi:hypothetical protein
MSSYTHQGNWGASLAEALWSAKGYNILSPKNDTAASYDFIAHRGNEYVRVSCKSCLTEKLKNGSWYNCVSLVGSSGKRIKVSEVDYVFLATPSGLYNVPAKELLSTKKGLLTLSFQVSACSKLRSNSKWHKFRVGDSPFLKEMMAK